MAAKSVAVGREQRRLRWLLLGLWLLLLVPTLLLGYQTYQRLRFESLHQYRLLAENHSDLVVSRIASAMGKEESRKPNDYRYITNGTVSALASLAPLSESVSELPGVVGYFEVDANGRLSSPLLPLGSTSAGLAGLSASAIALRQSRFQSLQYLLQRSALSDAQEKTAQHSVGDDVLGVNSDAAPQESQVGAFQSLPSPELSSAPSAAPSSAHETPKVSATPAPKRSSSQLRNQVLFETLAKNERQAERKRSKDATSAANELDLQTEYFTRAAKTKSGALPPKASPKKTASKRTKPLKNTAKPPVTRNQGSQVAKLDSSLRDTAAAFGLEQSTASLTPADAGSRTRVDLPASWFGAVVTDFELLPLSDSHLVLFRRVWNDSSPQVQGLVVERAGFFGGLVAAAYQQSALAGVTDLVVALEGEVQLALAAQQQGGRYATSTDVRGGELLYRRLLPTPFADVELLYSARDLPVAAGGRLVLWTLLVLVGLLCAGFAVLYFLGRRQLLQRQQQQDFVSAVSHELKTPLTSIRMYGEMLKSGWVAEEKKAEYYDYIFNESERLSRLINNVLQLSSITREQTEMQLQTVSVAQLLDLVQSRAAAQLDASGFLLDIQCSDATAQLLVNVDEDALLQVMINLIDNAVKFSHSSLAHDGAGGQNAQRVELNVESAPGRVLFSIRDFGPGIPRDQLSKIFELFYRSENELTRETVGTGIGLALVHELVTAMQGTVRAGNAEPGAQFTVSLPQG